MTSVTPLRIGIAVGALLLIGGAWFVQSDAPSRFTDTEAGFGPPASAEPMLVEESAEYDEADTLGTTSLAYLPPDPSVPTGMRIPWASYWREMSSEEMRAYGPTTRYQGPPRVGIQAGHWQLDTVPEELIGLRASSGAQGGGYTEQETVLAIARRVKTLLEADGVIVDLMPATVPVDYLADAFVSIHADGSSSSAVSGFKLSAPRRDYSGKAQTLTDAIYETYGEATGLRRDANITRRMSSYYAFNWRRYDHAIHPQTPGVIVETGFMTNANDRAIIVGDPDRAARGIADGVLKFLGIVEE